MAPLNTLAGIIKAADRDLKLTMLEIGAAPVEGVKEPFRELLDAFPGSQIVAFELDKQLCANLNRSGPRGIRYYPVALGWTEETQWYQRPAEAVGAAIAHRLLRRGGALRMHIRR